MLLLYPQGQCDTPPAVNRVNLRNMTCEVLLNSYQDKQFNSPNDVVVYKDGTIWFTGMSNSPGWKAAGLLAAAAGMTPILHTAQMLNPTL